MGTVFEEIISRKVGKKVKPGEIVTIEPDVVMSHDNSAFIIKKFKQTGVKEVWNKNKIVIIFDHCVPAEKPEHSQNHLETEEFAEEHDLPNYFGTKAGVSHQVMMEKGFVLPGQVALGADSHSTLYGAMNSLGIPINRTEMAGIWATGKIWLKIPRSIKLNCEGNLPKGVYAKDLVLKMLAELRADGATYKSIEYTGPTIDNLSMSARMTLSNMAVELGAKTGVMSFDKKTKKYLEGRSKGKYEPAFASEDAEYEKEFSFDVENLEPQIACPHTVDNVKPLSKVGEVKINQGYLGSCTNGRIEDLEIAADILEGEKIKAGVKLVVYPASKEVEKEAIEKGIYQKLIDAGAEIKTASCGPCFGAVGATLKDGEICISSSNRNFCGRMGSKNSFVYLASPAIVAASCIEGKIADSRKYV